MIGTMSNINHLNEFDWFFIKHILSFIIIQNSFFILGNANKNSTMSF